MANCLQPALPPHTDVAAVPASAPVLRWPSSSSLPTVEALSPPSLPTVEALPPPPAAKQGLSPSQRLSASEAALLTEFADVLNAEGCLPPTTHGVEHHIITEGRPVTANFWRLDNTKLAAAKEEFHCLEQEGIIRRSHSDWASPPPPWCRRQTAHGCLVATTYHRLNLLTEADCYPLPNMADITSSLAGTTVFSKLGTTRSLSTQPT